MQASLALILTSVLFKSICKSLIILVIGILAIRIVMKVIRVALEKSKLEKAAHSLITSLSKAAMYILLGLIVASTLGIDVTSIVALASVLTLALSLALQNMVSNIIGGFTILYTHPFHSGDYVEIAGQGGTVKEINMTYTMLATPDNKLISIPNSAVVAAQITNYSVSPTRRVEIVASASYEAPVQLVLEALLEAGAVDQVLPDPAPAAVVTSYGESAINYSLRLWVSSADYWDVYFAVNKRVKAIFDEKGIARLHDQDHPDNRRFSFHSPDGGHDAFRCRP